MTGLRAHRAAVRRLFKLDGLHDFCIVAIVLEVNWRFREIWRCD